MPGPVGDAPAAPRPGSATWQCPTCGNSYPADFTVCPRDATPRSEVSRLTDPLIGAVLGRTYKITRRLGEGGMARLYEAEHLRIESRFAVKVIHSDLARDADMLARFEREARAAARVRSEHVVRLIDVLRTADDRPCLVTELLEGEELQAVLDRVGKMPPAMAIPIARQICRAIATAHAVGVVHRDLKPANVFLCPGPGGSQVVKVFDFGVAKLADDDRLTRTDAVMGTAAYMAPEQARSAANAGPLVDVYAIGAVLYHMLTGEPPYGNVPAVSRYALVLHQEPARPRSIVADIPEGIEAVVQHAMMRDPATRVQSALALDEELAVFDVSLARDPAAKQAALARADTATAEVRPTGAADIAVRARLARPIALALAIASSLAAGAWMVALLASIVGPALTGSERTLIGVLAVLAITGVAAVQIRGLARRWRSAPAVQRHNQPVARALGAGITTFGAAELAAWGMAALAGGEVIGPAVRVVVAGVAAGIGLAWPVFRVDERLRRWSG
jgi:serine/threonine-protein kinase